MGREEHVGGVGNTQVAKSGLTFWFSNPETSLPVARVPDVLSKAPSPGRLWDQATLQSLPGPPPFGAAHGGSGSLASGSCTTPACALRPHLPPWHGPSFWDPAPTSLEAAEKAHVRDRDRTPLGAGPDPCPRPQQGGTRGTGPQLCPWLCPSSLTLVRSSQWFLSSLCW